MNLMDEFDKCNEQSEAVHELLEALDADARVGHTDWGLAPYRAQLADILERMVREADYSRIRRFLSFMEREEKR